MTSVTAFAPATVSNVACGFDVLGFALHEPGDQVTARFIERGVRIDGIENDGGRIPRDAAKNNYLGLDAVWTPIYGKMSLFNRRIVPFDMYFSLGAGQTGLTNAKVSSATSFHVGTGQIFAMSKGIGLRWDLSWNFYNATPQPSTGVTSTPPGESQFNNLLLTIGASFFFPEAKYR